MAKPDIHYNYAYGLIHNKPQILKGSSFQIIKDRQVYLYCVERVVASESSKQLFHPKTSLSKHLFFNHDGFVSRKHAYFPWPNTALSNSR